MVIKITTLSENSIEKDLIARIKKCLKNIKQKGRSLEYYQGQIKDLTSYYSYLVLINNKSIKVKDVVLQDKHIDILTKKIK